MHKLYELKEKLMRELEDYADNGKFSKDDVEAIKYTASAIDHICNICEDAEEYSEAGEQGMMGMGNQGGSYTYAREGRGGGRNSYRSYRSYARGRGRGARRDSMGRYSSEGGYSGDGDFRMEFEQMIEEAPSEHIKQKMREIMREM